MKHWTESEDAFLMENFTELISKGLKVREAINTVADLFVIAGYGRSPKTIENRYYTLKNVGNVGGKKKKPLDVDGIIESLESFKALLLAVRQENISTNAENKRLKAQIEAIQGQAKKHNELEENYNSLLRVIEQARKIVGDEEINKVKTAFKMDANGNLEQI